MKGKLKIRSDVVHYSREKTAVCWSCCLYAERMLHGTHVLWIYFRINSSRMNTVKMDGWHLRWLSCFG